MPFDGCGGIPLLGPCVSAHVEGSKVGETHGAVLILLGPPPCIPGPAVSFVASFPPVLLLVGVIVAVLVSPVVRPCRLTTHVVGGVLSLSGRAGSLEPDTAGEDPGGGEPCGGTASGGALVQGPSPGGARGVSHLKLQSMPFPVTHVESPGAASGGRAGRWRKVTKTSGGCPDGAGTLDPSTVLMGIGVLHRRGRPTQSSTWPSRQALLLLPSPNRSLAASRPAAPSDVTWSCVAENRIDVTRRWKMMIGAWSLRPVRLARARASFPADGAASRWHHSAGDARPGLGRRLRRDAPGQERDEPQEGIPSRPMAVAMVGFTTRARGPGSRWPTLRGLLLREAAVPAPPP